jgi:hypothetical protein
MTTDSLAFHWLLSGVFVLLGVLFVTRGRNYAGPASASCWIRFASPDGGAANDRIENAITRREAAEGPSPRLGLWLGAWSFVLAAVSPTYLVQPILLYALLCAGAALLTAAAFLRLRNVQPIRVAVLSARRTDTVIPPYWFYAATAVALMPLLFASNKQLDLPAIIVTASSLLTIAISWRLTKLPALLSGIDIPAEQIVDDRLRFIRSSAALAFGGAQPYAFVSQMMQRPDRAQNAGYCLAIGLVVWITFTVWMLRRRSAKVELA